MAYEKLEKNLRTTVFIPYYLDRLAKMYYAFNNLLNLDSKKTYKGELVRRGLESLLINDQKFIKLLQENMELKPFYELLQKSYKSKSKSRK